MSNQRSYYVRLLRLTCKIVTATSAKLKGLEKVFEGMTDPELIARMEDQYAETFNDLEEEVDDESDKLAVSLFEQGGDLGVVAYQNWTLLQLFKVLGLKPDDETDNPPFPFFNSWVSDLGRLPTEMPGFYDIGPKDDNNPLVNEWKLRELRPLWHQYVGLTAMVKQFLNGRNVLLADGVGVGKTMQVFMTCAYMRYLRLRSDKEKQVAIGESSSVSCDIGFP